MLKTAKKQNVYDLLIGLGADKKKAEFAIGEFVKDIPKILASAYNRKKFRSFPFLSRGDIWKFVITEIKRTYKLAVGGLFISNF